MSEDTIYAELARRFDKTFSKKGLEYISGAQCIGRLNQVLGVDGWDFRILSHEHNEAVDEVIVFGELTVRIHDRTVVKQQWGGQKVNRTRDGKVIELANDYKGASTDLLKKLASLLGVGTYLYPGDDAEPPTRVMHVPAEITPQEEARARAMVNGDRPEPVDRPALEASWAVIVEQAEEYKVEDWERAKSKTAAEMDDERLARSVRVMGKRVEEARSAAF